MASPGLLIGELLLILLSIKVMFVPGGLLWGIGGVVGFTLLAYHQYVLIRESMNAPENQYPDWREPVYPKTKEDDSVQD